MEINGLMLEAFKIFIGNPTIMIILITWTVFLTIFSTVIEISKDTE